VNGPFIAEALGGEYWTPAPLLEEIVAARGSFQSWHEATATGAS
jgi:hypothetical protein